MKNTPNLKSSCIYLIASVCFLASCKESAPEVAREAAPAGPSAALGEVLAAAPTGEPQAIHLVRNTAKPGEEITIHGRIMGSSRPFVAGRALFILGDPEKLTPCNEIPGDECDTPWDVCCDAPELKKIGTATVQIVDAGGQVLKEGVEGIGGLEKLAHVTVTGKVAEGSSADLLLVNASAIKTGKQAP
jgi:hypothetical protein